MATSPDRLQAFRRAPPMFTAEWQGQAALGIGDQTQKSYFVIAPIALLSYDVLITLDRETEFVWKRRRSVPAVLYFLIRYGGIVQAWITTYALTASMIPISPGQPVNCITQFYYLASWFCGVESMPTLARVWTITMITPLGLLIVEAMLAIRVVALFRDNKNMSLLIWILYTCSALATVTASVLQLVTLYAFLFDLMGAANYGPGNVPAWVIWFPSLMLEATFIVLTLLGAVHHRIKGVTTPLLALLVKDGLLYFVVVFALILVNIVLCASNTADQTLFYEMTFCLCSIFGSRLYLNLRELAAARDPSLPAPPTRRTDTRAPSSTWATTAETRSENVLSDRHADGA